MGNPPSSSRPTDLRGSTTLPAGVRCGGVALSGGGAGHCGLAVGVLAGSVSAASFRHAFAPGQDMRTVDSIFGNARQELYGLSELHLALWEGFMCLFGLEWRGHMQNTQPVCVRAFAKVTAVHRKFSTHVGTNW